MSSQFLKTDVSPSRMGHIVLTGVFCAVAIVFGARWFVAADYQSISVGDTVTPGSVSHGGGSWTVESISESGIATIVNNKTGDSWERELTFLSEK